MRQTANEENVKPFTPHPTVEKFYSGKDAPKVNFVGNAAPATEGKSFRGFSDMAVKLTPNQEAIALKHDYLSRRAYNWAVGVGEFSSVLYKALRVRTEETGHWVPVTIVKGSKVHHTCTILIQKKYIADANEEEAERLFTEMKRFVRENTSYYRKYWNGKAVKKTVSPRKIDEVRKNAGTNEEYKEEVNERAATEQGLYVSLFYAGLLNAISGNWNLELLMLDHELSEEDLEVQLVTRKKMAQHLHIQLTNIMGRSGIEKLLSIVQNTEVPEFNTPYILPSGKTATPTKAILKGALSSATAAFDRFRGGSGFPKRKKVSPSKAIRITSFEMDKNPLIFLPSPTTGKDHSLFLFPGMGNESISGSGNGIQLSSNYNRFQNFMNRYCTFSVNPKTGKPKNDLSVSQCSLRFDGHQWWLSVSVGATLPEERKRKRHKNAHNVVGIDRGARGHNMMTASHPVPRRDHHIRDADGNLVRTVPIVHIGANGQDLMDIPDTPKTVKDRARALKMQQDLSRRQAARKTTNDEHRATCQKNHSFYYCDKRNCVKLCAISETCQNYCEKVLPISSKEGKLRKDIARITSSLTRRNSSYKNQAASTVARMADTIAIEDLNAAGMMKAPKPKFAEDEAGNHIINSDGTKQYARNGSSAKRTLSRNISKAGFGEIKEKIKQHGLTYDANVAEVDRYFPSSQICSHCQHRNSEKSRSKQFVCESCQDSIDRDINAAANIEHNVTHHKQGSTWITPEQSAVKKPK